jgi:anti-sigma regulatory factor (Ser/Thr protein kinase)/N-acetylglutamate synthase-like GNAT family acetyltransferase
MKNSVSLKVPADIKYFVLVKHLINDIAKEIYFLQEDIDNLIEATRELVENSVLHGYKDRDGVIEITINSFDCGLRIDIQDWGFPMSYKKHSSVPIDWSEDRGFNRVYSLVDKFEYRNLGKDGKKFTIVKYFSCYLFPEINREVEQKTEQKEINRDNLNIIVRNFKEGDEESISKLIYQNYSYSYVKDLFYYPKKILEFEGKDFFSIVAEIDQKVVGHFALIKMPRSNIAEIGIVVVNPLYKGLGIMNKMFDALIQRAKELKFDAIFGEAMMYHIFSQKSNLSHSFFESAILIGKAPADIEIERNKLTKQHLRGSLLIGYYIFNYQKKELYIPKLYKDQIIKTYQNSKLDFTIADKRNKTKKRDAYIRYIFDPLPNIATIVIEQYGKHFEHKFLIILDQLRVKHCDMIYADIRLENNPYIDKIVKILNKRYFFYSGVLFLKYNGQDYLRLQNKHSTFIGDKNLVCYSLFCQELLDFINEDEKRVKR